MLLKVLKKDFIRKKLITSVLFLFIMISALLLSSGSNIIIELVGSLGDLFTKSDTPHFVQMYSGELNQDEIDQWSKENKLVDKQQTAELLNIENQSIYLGNNKESEVNSIMDNSFVVQNKLFDFLLDLNSENIQVSKGEIAVPVYYKQNYDLKIGDNVELRLKDSTEKFKIVQFVRDSQMNPSIIHSKRFVINKEDYTNLKSQTGEIEYLIEYKLKNIDDVATFTSQYQKSNLPKKGIVIDYSLFKTLNGLSDGIIAAVIILVSLLLSLIAVLCLRFTILATIEEDYREIGVLKAIGINKKDIKRIYMVKYRALALFACIIGYILSFLVNKVFTKNIMLYIGSASKSILNFIVPLIMVFIIYSIVILFCKIVLRKFNKITAVEAIRSGNMGEVQVSKKFMKLSKSRLFNINIFLGIRDVFQRFRIFSLLFVVFIICSFIIIVPVNFYNTIKSPSFITYMGVGRSDIRIDLQQSENVVERYEKLLEQIKKDSDIEKFSPLVTAQFKMINNEGAEENIAIENGDFSIFPVEYLNGKAPENDNEMALSYTNASELSKKVGDKIVLIIDKKEKQMNICGIYQDVTNGGKTSKARLTYKKEDVVRYIVGIDLKDKSKIETKMDEYSKTYNPARVTNIEGYLAQTLENIVEQLKLITIVAIIIALIVSILITSLFLQMLVAKDNSQIAILKSMGLAVKDIKIQYITKSLIVLNLGIIIGAIISNTLGQNLVGGLMSFLGASKIEFVINPLQAYIICPIALMVIVSITTLISIGSIKKTNIIDMIVE